MLEFIGFIILIDVIYLLMMIKNGYGSFKNFIKEIKNG